MDLEVAVERSYPTKEVIAKLRRLAAALEAEETFEIQIAGERIYIPSNAQVEFEYKRTADAEEVDIEFSWKRPRRLSPSHEPIIEPQVQPEQREVFEH